MSSQFSVHHCTSIAELDKADFNKLCSVDAMDSAVPFLVSYDFLLLMEQSQCVGDQAGWISDHIVVRDQAGTLVGFLCGYLKEHSMGEYVFDHNWAHAAHSNSIPYFPRWVSACPMMPCETAKILVATNLDKKHRELIVNRIISKIKTQDTSASRHILFPDPTDLGLLESQGFSVRANVHFRWHNQGYENMQGFYQALKSRHRKNIKKERAKAQKDISIRWVHGFDASAELMERMFLLYQITYIQRGRMGYLTGEFFRLLPRYCPDNFSLCIAEKDGEVVAGAMFFHDAQHLWGRFWGAAQFKDQLHFELCYYQGIEFAIGRKLKLFDPGVQGEHKIRRGFTPTVTWSAHHLEHKGLHDAVTGACQQEWQQQLDYAMMACSQLPFIVGDSNKAIDPAGASTLRDRIDASFNQSGPAQASTE